MKTMLTVILLSISALGATANGSFKFDFSKDPPCTATVTSNCIDHFSMWDVTNAPSYVQLTSIAPSSNPPLPDANTPIPFNFRIGAPYGTRKWAITATAKDSTGVLVNSDITAPAAQGTVVVKPGSPTALVVNVQ